MAVNMKSLIGKLNSSTRGALEAAAELCLSLTQYNIEVEHYLMKLMDSTDTDVARIFFRFGIDQSRLLADLTHGLDRLKSGNARTPAISPSVLQMLTEAWTLGSIDYGSTQIRTGLTILALTQNEELGRMIYATSKELEKIEADVLKKTFLSIVAGSHEDEISADAGEVSVESARRIAGGKSPNLDQYTVNLTENARKGGIDPVLGRDPEIRQIVDILMRRRQNNPILTGEAGVGKTAVVEGFALRIASGDVPPALRNVTLRTLDLALLQAGAGIKGEFENRLKGLIEEVKSSLTPIILFIDEAHTMIGAGGPAGQNDAANLLKPALARGELRTIAATTWSEYKKYFEKDPALARRFQVVKVDEPTEAVCRVMIRGIAASLERHHKVRILDEAVNAAVRLSHRYIAGRQLPDKAVSVLDTACARLALAQNSTPPSIENATRELEDLAVQDRVLRREAAAGADHMERLDEIKGKRTSIEAHLADLSDRFQKEVRLVSQIRDLRSRLEDGAGNDDEAKRAELGKLNEELAALQAEVPLLRVCVDSLIVGEVVSAWTGIPVGKMLKDEVQTVLALESHLGSRVIGQTHALEAISQRIRTSRASLEDPHKPVGVFLLVGPSGVGKTETALALADMMYGGERNLITINMSEFQEAHTVSTLKGSPPGYVGYGEGGVLTEAVRRRPYSVVLLDEVEKAHPDVLELFFQVFDNGQMEDGEGREIDFKNTIIILTSNAATDTITRLCRDPERTPSSDEIVKAIKPELNRRFKPAFLGRMVIIPYYPISDGVLKHIVELKLAKIQRRLLENHKIHLQADDVLVAEIARRCTEGESGARNVDNVLTNTLLPEVSCQILGRIAEGQKLDSIHVGVGADGGFRYEWSAPTTPQGVLAARAR